MVIEAMNKRTQNRDCNFINFFFLSRLGKNKQICNACLLLDEAD